MNPIARQNIITARVWSQPLNDAATRKRPGTVNESVVYSFLEFVRLIFSLLIHQSLMKPKVIVEIHIVTYGSDEKNPLALILNFKTSFMYFGKSVTTVK